MGTQLFARGAQPGQCNDWLNVKSPDMVMEIHRAYFDAGSDAVLTNTFGANRYALARHGCADKTFEINRAGAQVARKAAGDRRYVLGDIGPTGDFLEPLGTLRAEQVREAYVEQVQGLREGGVDGFIIETMTALDELCPGDRGGAVGRRRSACLCLHVLRQRQRRLSDDDGCGCPYGRVENDLARCGGRRIQLRHGLARGVR